MNTNFTNNKAVILTNTDVTACDAGTNFGGYGGAIVTPALVVIDSSRFTSNSATFAGGAIISLNYMGDSMPSVAINSTFTSNSAPLGGAVFGYLFSAEGSTFTANSAQQVGGAIVGLSVTSNSSTFVRNRAASGGAIWAIVIGEIVNSTFKRNTATALRTPPEEFEFLGPITVAGGLGGAIAGSAGPLTLTNNRFTGNRASVAGGAVWFDYVAADCLALMTKNRFVGNRAGKAGGAVGFSGSASTVTRSQLRAATRANRFSGNSAPRGSLIQSRAMILWIGGIG